MSIELRTGMFLYPGSFNAVIAPDRVIITAINRNPELQRFLFLFVSGNYSRILLSIGRISDNFEICRAFTAHQLFSILQNASHTVIFVEHGTTRRCSKAPGRMLSQVATMLKETGWESLVILYSPAMDRTFSALWPEGGSHHRDCARYRTAGKRIGLRSRSLAAGRASASAAESAGNDLNWAGRSRASGRVCTASRDCGRSRAVP